MVDSFISASTTPRTRPPAKATAVNHSVLTRAVVMIPGNIFAATSGLKNSGPIFAQSVLTIAQTAIAISTT